MVLLVYLASRFTFRLKEFFTRWFIRSFFRAAHYLISLLERLDRKFALAVTLRHFSEPLYGDYTPVGRILGLVFRGGRAAAASILYFFIIIFFAVIYFSVWWLIPAYALSRILF